MLWVKPVTSSWESPPAREQVQLVGSRAQHWLLALCARAGRDIPLCRLLQALVGCWICDKGLTADLGRADWVAIARMVQARLEQASSRDEASSVLLACDPAIVLLSAGILRALACDDETLTTFVDQVGAGVREL